MLTCFVVGPLAAPFLLLLPLPIDSSDLWLYLAVTAVAALAAWLIAYWPKRNGWEAVLYAMVTAVLTLPAFFFWFLVVISMYCSGKEQCD
jgi:hypothetical protein